MPMQSELNVIVQLCWTRMVVRTGEKGGKGVTEPQRERKKMRGVSPFPPRYPDNIIVMADSKFLLVLALTTFFTVRIFLREITILKLLLIRSVMTDTFCHNCCLR